MFQISVKRVQHLLLLVIAVLIIIQTTDSTTASKLPQNTMWGGNSIQIHRSKIWRMQFPSSYSEFSSVVNCPQPQEEIITKKLVSRAL